MNTPGCPRKGFSLTELLVASGIGLMVMAAVATLFSTFSRSLTQSQSTVELSARMRATAWKLRQDLDGVTCPVNPWLSPDANAGYFEIFEGPQRDSTAGQGSSNLEADTDDILMFTTRAPNGTFSGRYLSSDRIIESPYAEVAWFCQEAANQPVAGTKVYNLHRRQLLVLGYVGLTEFSSNSIAGALPVIYQAYDLSLRSEGGQLHPNTLGDLTKRENRLAHGPTFPHPLEMDATARLTSQSASFSQTPRVWEDVILTNVIAFDIRVFDPQAKAQTSGTTTLYPGDPGYTSGMGASGAYIDLGGGQGGRLAQAPDSKSGLVPPTVPTGVATYDTWSQSYIFGGLGFNDPTRYDRAPPYPVPLSGVEVRIRCYDPTSKQVRQVTVHHTFGSP
ncbi:MAG: prepilin-type N-terminal cleavage/methylation domain-containing protein [Planctomycetota bacterium]